MFDNQLVPNPSKSTILAERSPLTTLKVGNPSLIVHQEITLSSVTSAHNCGELFLNVNLNFICLVANYHPSPNLTSKSRLFV
jgi:hypothetical protein